MAKSIKLKNGFFLNGEICDYLFSANGYVRWANGFQIVWNTITLTTEFAQHGALFYTYTKENEIYPWTKPFKNIFAKFVTPNTPGFFAAGVNAGTINITNLRAYRAVNDNAHVTLFVLGIGTWK